MAVTSQGMGVPSTDETDIHTPVDPSGGPLADEGAVLRLTKVRIGPDELFGRAAQQLLGPVINVQDGALFAKKDRLQGGIGQLVKPCLARAQCRLAARVSAWAMCCRDWPS